MRKRKGNKEKDGYEKPIVCSRLLSALYEVRPLSHMWNETEIKHWNNSEMF